jgi:MFS family permease
MAAILFIAASLLALGLRDHRPHSQSTGLHLSRVSPWLLATGFLAFAGIGFPSFIAKLFPMDEFRMSEGQVGLLVLPTAILLAVLSAPAGRLATRLGARTTVFAGLVLCAIGTGMIGLAAIRPESRTVATVMIAAPLVGVGFLIALPAWYAYVGGAAGSATRLGAVMAAQGIGAIAAAPLGAAMYEKLQPFGVASRLGPSFAHWSPFLAASGCLAAAAIVFLAASGPAREPSDDGR